MKKVLSAIGIGSLMLILLLALSFTSVSASHVQSSASEASTSIEPTDTRIMFISDVEREFEHYPPPTIKYNNHGWTGTLTRVKVEGNVGTYEGYVSCSGVCPMSEQLDQ